VSAVEGEQRRVAADGDVEHRAGGGRGDGLPGAVEEEQLAGGIEAADLDAVLDEMLSEREGLNLRLLGGGSIEDA